MDRKPNTNQNGEPFPVQIVDAVWKKAISENGFSFFKKDGCGATIKLTEYGEETQYGWEIDHIKPVSQTVPMSYRTCRLCTGGTIERKMKITQSGNADMLSNLV